MYRGLANQRLQHEPGRESTCPLMHRLVRLPSHLRLVIASQAYALALAAVCQTAFSTHKHKPHLIVPSVKMQDSMSLLLHKTLLMVTLMHRVVRAQDMIGTVQPRSVTHYLVQAM